MFTRSILRTAFPPTVKIAKTAIAAQTSNRYHIDFAFHLPSICSTKFIGPQRLYSQQAATENMCVDFEYVKMATNNKNVLIVDVREPDELKEHGKIPNSINIPLGTVTTTLSEMPEKEFENTFKRSKPSENTEIIFYCMIGKRSGKAQENAQKLGYKNVKNYLGSFTDWAAKTKV